MGSAVVTSCACGVSAVKMQRKERLAALVNIRLTAAQTSAVLSIKVQYSTQCSICSVSLYVLPEIGSVCFLCGFSPALPCLLGQAHWAWALLRCLQPPGRAVVLGRPGWGTQETLPLRRRSPLPAPGVSAVHLIWQNVLNCVFVVWANDSVYINPRDWNFTCMFWQARVHVP